MESSLTTEPGGLNTDTDHHFRTMCRLTLLTLFLFPERFWYISLPAGCLAISGLLFEQLQRRPGYWITIFLVLVAVNFANWDYTDNHQYVITFWTLALGLSLRVEDTEKIIRLNSRLIIGLVFAFATFWKLTSGDFMSGATMQMVLGVMSNFSELGTSVDGYSAAAREANIRALSTTSTGAPTIAVAIPENLKTLATVITIGTLVFELAIAVLFLLPENRKWDLAKNWILLVFVALLYPVSEIIAFGWILLVLGYAQCGAKFPRLRYTYVGLFVILYLFRFGHLKAAFFNLIS